MGWSERERGGGEQFPVEVSNNFVSQSDFNNPANKDNLVVIIT